MKHLTRLLSCALWLFDIIECELSAFCAWLGSSLETLVGPTMNLVGLACLVSSNGPSGS